MLNSDVWNLKVRFQDFCFLVGYPILEGIIGHRHSASFINVRHVGTQYLLTLYNKTVDSGGNLRILWMSLQGQLALLRQIKCWLRAMRAMSTPMRNNPSTISLRQGRWCTWGFGCWGTNCADWKGAKPRSTTSALSRTMGYLHARQLGFTPTCNPPKSRKHACEGRKAI
jgi:hypothetical protein